MQTETYLISQLQVARRVAIQARRHHTRGARSEQSHRLEAHEGS